MIRRDRNHPCVLAWEFLNESWMSENFIDRIAEACAADGTTHTAGWQEYGYDIYLQARQHRIGHPHRKQKPILFLNTEIGNMP